MKKACIYEVERMIECSNSCFPFLTKLKFLLKLFYIKNTLKYSKTIKVADTSLKKNPCFFEYL